MKKSFYYRLYTGIALFIAFIISIILFSRDIPSINVTTTTATSVQDATFPIMYIKLNDVKVNTLHGYSMELDSSKVRESITPLDTEKTFSIMISENESKIKKCIYTVHDIANDKDIETGEISAFDKEDKYKTTSITLNEGLDTSTEYGLKIVLITNRSKKIYFYSRIKYYESDFFLDKKLKFVESFHDATFDNGKSLDISKYLDANTNDGSTYSNVDINSSEDMIMWGELKPEKLTEAVPTIRELNIETAAVSQDYFITANTGASVETYHIKEYYRVRFDGQQMYLLYFHRSMNSKFDPSLISIKKSEIKIGISSEKDVEIMSSDKNKKTAFVRNGALWYYDIKKRKIINVFSFETDSDDYLRNAYDQHDIRIINIDDDGNINFVVYGYMNCGDYEGTVGILLYNYDAKHNRITERVYIPMETTYELLKQDFKDLCYVNQKDLFYFSVYDKVFSYNLSSRQYTIISDSVTRDNFVMLKNAHCFAWTTKKKDKPGNTLNILNTDTTKTLEIDAPANQTVITLGTIDSNIVYGYVMNSDIHESTGGNIITPAYKVVISDFQGNILREYQAGNKYVTDAIVENNIIRLKRIKKKNSKWSKTSEDTILNQKSDVSKSFNLTTRVTDIAKTELYISLPAGYIMDSLPNILYTKTVMITENTTVHLNNTDESTLRYYVYAYGDIINSFTDISKAIISADENMGVVMDSKSHIVWERGGRFNSREISGISFPAGKYNSIKKATQMLLQGAQVTVDTSELSGNSIMSMLNNRLDQPVNLSGCTLDEILYFIGKGFPVIGMINDTQAVLIMKYDTASVTWMNPDTKKTQTMSLQAAEKLFEEAGYVFVSYVSN